MSRDDQRDVSGFADEEPTVLRPLTERPRSGAPATGSLVADRYRIEGILGSGGGGVVLRARDLVAGSSVALKIATGNDARSEREARMLASLRHPAIVACFDHGFTATGGHYLVMELLTGETLRARLARGPLSIVEACRLVARVSGALAFAHARGIVHRDVKPSNVFLPGGVLLEAKLIDFGVATERADFRGTLTGQVVGTPLYMSPEQASGSRDVDPRSDIFSTGCLLLECVTGRPVFAGRGVAGFAKLALSDLIVEECARALPPALADYAARMLSHDRDRRPSRADLVAEHLSSLAETLAENERSCVPESPRSVGIGEQEARSLVVLLVSRPLSLAASTRENNDLTDLAARWSADLQHLPSGATLLTFGLGSARDQAARAAQAALEIRARTPDRAMGLALARATLERHAVVGPAIDETTRLVGLPDLSGRDGALPIRLDRAAAELLVDRFEITGFDAGNELALLGARDVAEPERLLLGRPVPFVGRESEVGELERLVTDCFAESSASGALVLAPAGGGKSRLRRELMTRLESHRGQPLHLVGEPDALRAGAPFGLLSDALRKAAGIGAPDSPDVRREKMSAFVERTTGERRSPEERRRIVRFFGELVGAARSEPSTADDPSLFAAQVRVAWMDFIEGALTVAPVLVLFEDLHWGDAPTVQLVELALRTFPRTPLFLLALGRPEAEERFPGLARTQVVKRFDLSPLRARESRALVQAVWPDLDDARLESLITRAQGNPFFLEELVRAEATDARDEGKSSPAPPSVLAVVQARLDQLGDDAKRVLRAASIFGETFRKAGVEALLEPAARHGVAHWLDTLFERELILPRTRSDHRERDAAEGGVALEGWSEWSFRHALVRDAAYDTLTETDRQAGHLLAGGFLEATGERDAMVLAEHFERGGASANAVRYVREAAEQSLHAGDFANALARCQRGEMLGAAGEELGRLKLAESRACWALDEQEKAYSAATVAASLLKEPERWAAEAERVVAAFELGRSAEVLSVAEILCQEALHDSSAVALRAALKVMGAFTRSDAQEVTARVQKVPRDRIAADPHSKAMWHYLRAEGGFATAPFRERISDYRIAIQQFTAACDWNMAASALGNEMLALLDSGCLDEAHERIPQIMALAERTGHVLLRKAVVLNTACIAMARGDLHAARVACEEFGSIGRETDNPFFSGFWRLLMGQVCLAESRARSALAWVAAATQPLDNIPPYRAPAAAAMARALNMLGRINEARKVAQSALESMKAVGRCPHGEYLVWLAAVESLRASASLEEARAVAHEARAALFGWLRLLDTPEERARYIAAQPDLLRLIEEARSLGVTFPTPESLKASTDPSVAPSEDAGSQSPPS